MKILNQEEKDFLINICSRLIAKQFLDEKKKLNIMKEKKLE